MRLLNQAVESELDISNRTDGGDKKSGEHDIEGNISPAVGAAAQILSALMGTQGFVPTGIISAVGGKYNYKRSWEKSTAQISTESREFAGNTELSILHHAAFDIVMRRMQSKLVIVKGNISILSLSMIKKMFKILKDKITVDDAEAITLGFEMMDLLDIQSIVQLGNEDRRAHAFLRDEWATIPLNSFPTHFGIVSQKPFTLVGIRSRDIDSGFTSLRNKNVEPNQMLVGVEGATQAAFETLGVGKDSQRLYPIAIFREL